MCTQLTLQAAPQVPPPQAVHPTDSESPAAGGAVSRSAAPQVPPSQAAQAAQDHSCGNIRGEFGKLFKLHSAHGQSETAETAGKASKSGSPEKLHVEGTHSGEDTPDNETGRQDEMPQKDAWDNNTTSRKVKVSDIVSAKDYLADTFGISRTSMRSTKAIMEQAAANGIEFEGLE